jgi:hypothetical protein
VVEEESVAAAVRRQGHGDGHPQHVAGGARRPGRGLEVGGRRADLVAHAPGSVPGADPALGRELGALAVHLDPAAGHPDVVEAQHVGIDAVPAAADVDLLVLDRRRHHPGQLDVEGDGHDVVGVQGDAHPLERLEHLVAQRADLGPLRVGGQAAAAAHGPLLRAPRDAGEAVHDVAVGVLAEPEGHAERAVDRGGHGPELLGPGPVGLADPGEGVGDLVREALVGSQQRPGPSHGA